MSIEPAAHGGRTELEIDGPDMKAAWYERSGPARQVLEVGDLDTPAPGPGEVRVRMHASGVNPSDVKARGGAPGRALGFARVVPNNDGAGVIDRVGATVPEQRVGERVWLYSAQQGQAFGTAAEYCVVPADRAVRLPPSTDFDAGACLGVPAMTAYTAVLGTGPVAGRTVLVTGGAGGVGYYAVQMAALHGASVITTVSSDTKAAHARAAGAHHTVNYRDEDVVERVRELTAGRGVDLLVDLDLSAQAALLPGLVAPFGTVASYGSAGNEVSLPVRALRQRNINLRFLNVYALGPERLPAIACAINGLLEADALRHAIGARFSLAACAEAHEAVERGQTLGKVIIDIA